MSGGAAWAAAGATVLWREWALWKCGGGPPPAGGGPPPLTHEHPPGGSVPGGADGRGPYEGRTDEGAHHAVPRLTLDNLGRSVAGHSIVAGVNAEVAAGEILAVVGPSGSGKSSLLRLINRLDDPSEGTVYLDGVDYRTIPAHEVRRRVGLVMQRPVLFPGVVRDNVAAGPSYRGEAMSTAQVERLLAEVGLPGLAGRDVATLSGGEVQRVALARTLANEPEVLLLDEPTSALDGAAARAVEALVVKVVSLFEPACVLVTHDAAQAARLAARVMTLENGRFRRPA